MFQNCPIVPDCRTPSSQNLDISIAAFKIEEVYILFLLSVAVEDSCSFV